VELREIFAPLCAAETVKVSDPEVVCSTREAGDAKYFFLVNDHQLNPTSAEMRKKRTQYNHFSLMPGEFTKARTLVTVKGQGWVYPLLVKSSAPLRAENGKPAVMDVTLEGGDGRVFMLLPDQISRVQFASHPVRGRNGVRVNARVMSMRGILKASVPVRIDLRCGDVQQTVYSTTRDGIVDWTVPYIRDFPGKPMSVTVTDMASGKSIAERSL